MIQILFLAFAIPEKAVDVSHSTFYNRLPEVEQASLSIRSREDFGMFLGKFGELVKKHQLEEVVGLRLIHKHFNVFNENSQQQVMCEDFVEFKEQPALITRAQELSTVLAKAKAASWIFDKESREGLPFEFSSDPAVIKGRGKIDSAQNFFEEARHLIVENNYESILSLAVVDREFLFPRTKDHIFREDSYFYSEDSKKNASVVQVCETKDTEGYAETLWRFITEGPKTLIVCSGKCTPNSDKSHTYRGFHIGR